MSATAPHPPTVLTYSYNLKLAYVTPGESYEQAVDFALEVFPELREIDRSLICFEIRVVLSNQAERKMARIGRMSWVPVVATLAQFEIVEIHIAPPSSAASSPSTPTVAQPPPYASASETGWSKDTEGPPASKAPSGPAPGPSQQPPTRTLISRVMGLFRQR